MVNIVRYRGNGDNSVLRSVLYDVWDYKCYWCGRPKDFNDIEIDHIIPKSVRSKRLQELTVQLSLPKDFDVHDPSNLAPICRTCNGSGTKGDAELGHIPLVLSKLHKAERLRLAVINKVQSFADSGKLAKALMLAKEADLRNPAARQAFVEHAPAVVQRLMLLNDAPTDFASFRTVDVYVNHEFSWPGVGLSLDAKTRRAVTILEDACEATLEDVIEEPVIDLFQKIHLKVQQEFESISGPAGPTRAGYPNAHYIRVDIDSIDFARAGLLYEFKFAGNFEADLSASLLRDSEDGSELVEVQGDSLVVGRYSFMAEWDNSEDAAVEAIEARIDSWDSDFYPQDAEFDSC